MFATPSFLKNVYLVTVSDYIAIPLIIFGFTIFLTAELIGEKNFVKMLCFNVGVFFVVLILSLIFTDSLVRFIFLAIGSVIVSYLPKRIF